MTKSDKTEEDIYKVSSHLIRRDIDKIYQSSLNSLILSNLENLMYKNKYVKEHYENVYFCGGVLNSAKFSDSVKINYEYMVNEGSKKEIKYNFSSSKINDNIYSFYKGANYLSKLDTLDSIMITRQNYFESGKDRLCFEFI